MNVTKRDRVLVYDSRQGGLTAAWAVGSFLGRFGTVVAANSWAHAIDVLLDAGLTRPRVLQVWGHGRPGAALIDGDPMPVSQFASALPMHPDGYVWFRSCAVFAGGPGWVLARHAARSFGCRVVGHTRVISAPFPWCQSGGHSLEPYQEPYWSVEEGFDASGDLMGSSPGAPNTCNVWAMDPPGDWRVRAVAA
jgi:hypothetical protein